MQYEYTFAIRINIEKICNRRASWLKSLSLEWDTIVPLASDGTGRLYLLHREQKDLARDKEDGLSAVIRWGGWGVAVITMTAKKSVGIFQYFHSRIKNNAH
jgi:hypothetical protein